MSEKIEIKRIPIKEFREIGFLQELNRQFLHPLGMALEVVIDDKTGEETLGGIWDSRDDPEGFIYDLKNSKPERVKAFIEKRDRVNSIIEAGKRQRYEKLGYYKEPVKQSKLCKACLDRKDSFFLNCKQCKAKGGTY